LGAGTPVQRPMLGVEMHPLSGDLVGIAPEGFVYPLAGIYLSGRSSSTHGLISAPRARPKQSGFCISVGAAQRPERHGDARGGGAPEALASVEGRRRRN
jgi:hypothetical protein